MSNLHYRDIINFFVEKFGYKSYLELGVRDLSNTFNQVRCDFKEGVDIDPYCNPTHHMSTDEFFAGVGKDKTWDIILIDADHEKNQVLKDFENCLTRLNDGGTIIMDDINPTEEWLLSPTYCNNAWEAFAELSKRSDIQLHAVVPTYAGFVRRGKQKGHSLQVESDFSFLSDNRDTLVRPITFQQLQNMFTK
jgi:hypothetical protein